MLREYFAHQNSHRRELALCHSVKFKRTSDGRGVRWDFTAIANLPYGLMMLSFVRRECNAHSAGAQMHAPTLLCYSEAQPKNRTRHTINFARKEILRFTRDDNFLFRA